MGAGARENRGGRDKGRREKKGRQAGSPREKEIQKNGKRSLFITGYDPAKNTNPVTFFDFNLISSEALNNFYMRGDVHSYSD